MTLEALLVTPQDLGPGWSTREPTEYRSFENLFSNATKCHLRLIKGIGAETDLDSLSGSVGFQETVIWTPNASQTFSVIKKATASGCFKVSAYSDSIGGGPFHRLAVIPISARKLGSFSEIASAWRMGGNPIRYEEEYFVLADSYVIRMSYTGLRIGTKELTIALGIL